MLARQIYRAGPGTGQIGASNANAHFGNHLQGTKISGHAWLCNMADSEVIPGFASRPVAEPAIANEPKRVKIRGEYFLLIGRLAFAAIFLFAAYAKLKPQAAMPWSVASVKTSLSMFAMQVDSYQLLSPQAVSAAAHWLPFIELALGLWLLSGLWLRYSSLFTTLLLGGFFALMVRTYSMGLEINCGCFGPGEQTGDEIIATRRLAFGVFTGCHGLCFLA